MSKVLPSYGFTWLDTEKPRGRSQANTRDLPTCRSRSVAERNARRLEERLRGVTFAKVVTSPLRRVIRTCELAGFGPLAEIDRDLLEWNYGE